MMLQIQWTRQTKAGKGQAWRSRKIFPVPRGRKGTLP